MMWKQYPNKRIHKTHDMDSLMAIAKDAVEAKTAESRVLSQAESKVPEFGHDEIDIGRFLGKGGFCTVHEISKVVLDDEGDTADTMLIETNNSRTLPGYGLYLGTNSSHHSLPSPNHDESTEPSTERATTSPPKEAVQDRAFMSSQYRRGRWKGCRYALKRVTVSKTTDAGTFVNAIVDLAVEAKFLAVLRHPNIIKMRGTAVSDPFHSEDAYFIVLDRLYEIYGQRLLKWKSRKNSIVAKLVCQKKSRDIDLWVERLKAARDIASALTYLHDRCVIYRDIKPDNIGFDVRGDVKIFDFGLAKEFDRSQQDSEGTFKLTGDTGSPRFMAPEVALSKPYNEKADVYSFTVLLWETLQLDTPFEGYTMSKFYERVVNGGIRPKVDPEWPSTIQNIMHRGWSSKISKRPSMSYYASVLRSEINQHEQVLSTKCHKEPFGLVKEESFDDSASRKSELSYIRYRNGMLSN